MGEKLGSEREGGDDREAILVELQKVFDAGGENALLHKMQL